MSWRWSRFVAPRRSSHEPPAEGRHGLKPTSGWFASWPGRRRTRRRGERASQPILPPCAAGSASSRSWPGSRPTATPIPPGRATRFRSSAHSMSRGAPERRSRGATSAGRRPGGHGPDRAEGHSGVDRSGGSRGLRGRSSSSASVAVWSGSPTRPRDGCPARQRPDPDRRGADPRPGPAGRHRQCRRLRQLFEGLTAFDPSSTSAPRSPSRGTSSMAAAGSSSTSGPTSRSPTARRSPAMTSSAAGCGSSTPSSPRRWSR